MKRMQRAGTKTERGFSILEALIASVVMIIGICGLMALFVVAAAKNAGQGDQATRCTEYAQDKMEQLLALNYSDTTSLAVGSSTAATGGPGLTGSCTGGCGSVTPGSPVNNYVDYVNPASTASSDGISTTAAGATYVRQWSIQDNTPSANMKTITVYVQAQFTADRVQSLAPKTTMVAYKGQY